jgi:hypothetical protein
MKKVNLILIFLLFISLGIISCHKEDKQNESNFISSNINEVKWNGIPKIHTNEDNDTLILIGSGNEQVIVFKIKFKGKGNYTLKNSQANYYTTFGGDVMTSLYTLDASSSSQITITEYNSEQNILKGNFELSLLKEWSNPENNVNKLIFKNGGFKVTIDD